MERIRIITAIAAVCLSASTSFAQRTAEGQSFVGVKVGTFIPFTSSTTSGAVSLGRYLPQSLIRVSVGRTKTYQEYTLSSNDDPFVFNDEHGYFDIQRYCIEGNWMYRLLSSYTRGFNLYAGAGAFAGMTRYGIEQPVPDRYTEKKGSDYLSDQKKSDSTGGIPDKEPCFGVNASIEAEVFITRSIAATAECTIPWTSNSSLKKYFDTELVKPLLSVGLRYDF